MNSFTIMNKDFSQASNGVRNRFSRQLQRAGFLLKANAPTLVVSAVLALLMTPDALAQVDGVDKIIKGVSDSILPNFKYGVGVLSGVSGLCLFIFGLVKSMPKVMGYGAGLAIIPATLWDSVVGGAATVLIP